MFLLVCERRYLTDAVFLLKVFCFSWVTKTSVHQAKKLRSSLILLTNLYFFMSVEVMFLGSLVSSFLVAESGKLLDELFSLGGAQA